MIDYSKPDLTQFPPRSPRIRLGGYVILPRLLDKCRAELAGTNGSYHFACPLDQNFLRFAGIEADAIKAEVAAGKKDAEIIQWVEQNAKNKPSDWQIAQWSAFREQAAPSDNETREYVSGAIKESKIDHREDIGTFFEWLDADDFATFGGPA